MDSAAASGGGDGEGSNWMQNVLNFAASSAVAFENEGVFGLAQATVVQTTSIAGFVASAATSAAVHVVSEASANVGRLLHGGNEEKGRVEERAHEERNPVLKFAFNISDIIVGSILPNGIGGGCRNEKYPILYNRDVKLITDGAPSSSDEFYDAECSCGESLYFDAISTPSLSIASFASSDESYDEVSYRPVPTSVVVTMTDSDYVRKTSIYYLDVSLLSDMDQNAAQLLPGKKNSNGDLFCCIGDSEDGINHVLDILVEMSLRTAMDGSSGDSCNELCWTPDGDSYRILEDCKGGGSELSEVLETEVLKWTSSSHRNDLLKTQGIINMSALDLKDLLLDCEKAHLFNKNSVLKEDICTYSGVETGEAKIVKSVLKIPVVGGTIHNLSLTHSRCIGDGGFILVSISVGEECACPAHPIYSISILRAVTADKTELTNIIQSAAMPIPKFLVRKVTFMGAMDFFNNLRALCDSPEMPVPN